MADEIQSAFELFGGAVTLVPGGAGVTVRDAAKLRSAATDQLVWKAVFGTADERDAARWLLWELGQATGARPASIHDLYIARGRGETGGVTGAAVKVRLPGFDKPPHH